jgi:hypothetical protein
MRAARRAIRSRRKSSLAAAYARRYRMRSNPSGTIGGFISVLKGAAPIAVALYTTRFATRKLATRIPGLSSLPAQAQGPAMAALMMFGAHLLTKKVKPLQKYRGGAMVGTALNFFDAVVSAFAPASVKAQIGVGDIYDSVGEYMGVGEYVGLGAAPIDDDITLSDYVEVGVEEDLGLEEELGLSEELGGPLDREWLGGVSQDAMLKTIGKQPLLAAVPERSFTKQIPNAGPGYDNANRLYGGIFGGGF